MRGSLKKDAARGTWSFTVDVGPNPSTGERRRIHRRGFATKRRADDAMRIVLEEARQRDYVEPSSQPVRVYLENWLAMVAVSRKPSTAAMYAHKMRRYVIPRIGGAPLRQLDAAMLDALYADLRAHGGRQAGATDGAPLSEQTVAVVHRILHCVFADAVKRRVIRFNPASDATVPRSTAPRTMAVWSAAEVRGFLEHAADHRLHALWVLAATTGMRRGELCGLMWHDINLEQGTVAVQRARVPIAGRVAEGTPKSDRARVIALAASSVAALRSHRAQQLTERLAWGEGWEDTGYVFTREDGTPVRPDAVSPSSTHSCARPSCRGFAYTTFDTRTRRSASPPASPPR